MATQRYQVLILGTCICHLIREMDLGNILEGRIVTGEVTGSSGWALNTTKHVRGRHREI